MIISVIFQISFGFLTVMFSSRHRQHALISLWSQLHKSLGRLLGLAGIVNIFLGFQLYKEQGYELAKFIPIIFGIYIALVVSGFILTDYHVKIKSQLLSKS